MKLRVFNLTLIYLTACLFGCGDSHTGEQTKLAQIKLDSGDENPCIECTQKIQVELASCLQAAGTNQEKKAKCNAKASSDWTQKCRAICTPSVTQSLKESDDQETPRMKCLKEAQRVHLECYNAAKTDKEKKACNETLSADLAKCPRPTPN